MLRVFTQLTLNTAHLHRSARALGLEDGFPIRGPSRGAVLLTSAMVTVADLIVAVAVASSTAGSQVAHHQPTQPKGRLRREGGGGGGGGRVTPDGRRKCLHTVQSPTVVRG